MSPEVGSAAEEARRLIEALDQRLPEWLREHVGDATIANGAPECRLCPLCRLIAALRERSDGRGLAEAVSDLSASLLGLVDAVMDDRRRSGGRQGPTVEHIDID